MLKITWRSETTVASRRCKVEEIGKIAGHRRAAHTDLPALDRLINLKTCDLFGDVDIGRIYESSCFTVLQYNEHEEVTSGICVCDYPNVPAVPSNGWLEWLVRHYGIDYATTKDTMFIHLLVWDSRYTDEYFSELVRAFFNTATFCLYLILVLPPRVLPDSFEKHMVRIVPNGTKDTLKIQALYMALRHSHNPRLKIRLAVEEDNDDVIPIIDEDSALLKKFYGEFYLSEMTRNPDPHRGLIVSENEDGLANGVMFVNETIDVDFLHQNFELTPYNGLRKLKEKEEELEEEEEPPKFRLDRSVSVVFSKIFAGKSQDPMEDLVTFQQEESQRVKDQKDSVTESADETKVLTTRSSSRKSSLLRDPNRRTSALKGLGRRSSAVEDTKEEEVGEREKRLGTENERDARKGAISPNKRKKSIQFSDNEESERVQEEERMGTKISQIKEVEIEELYRRTSAFGKEVRKVRISDAQQADVPVPSTRRSSLKQTTRLVRSKLEAERSKSDVEVRLSKERTSSTVRIELPDETEQRMLRTSIFEDTIKDVLKVDASIQEKVKATEVTAIQTALQLPSCEGETNAFVVEVYAVRKEHKLRRNREFLEAAFEYFPHLDYCVLLVPASYPTFSFLDNFVQIPLRCNKDFPMSLYLAHRTALFGKIVSREAEIIDLPRAQRFLEGVSNSEGTLEALRKILHEKGDDGTSSYVFECDETIIGLAIIQIEENHDTIKADYHVEDYVSTQNIRRDGYARILHFVFMPIFAANEGFFFCEIMRLANLTVLYYRLYEKESSSITRRHPLMSFLNSMVPVNPRKRIKYEFCECPDANKMSEEEYTLLMEQEEEEKEIYSLFMTTPRLAVLPKKIIETKIIVVGASDCGVALLEYLALGYSQNFTHFTNLTLISPNGLPYEKKRNRIVKMMIPFKGRYCHEYRYLVASRAWINIIYGTVIAINRKDKFVTVMNQGNVTYDFLVLTCGLQYQRTLFREKLDLQLQSIGNIARENIISNCLTVNDDMEAFHCIGKVRTLTQELQEKKTIIFYGHNIECYCAINGLLKLGVKGPWITLIEPKLTACDSHDSIFFHNCEVDVAVMNEILNSGVIVLSQWNVVDWKLSKTPRGEKFIDTITINSTQGTKEIPCDLFFNFYEKGIDLYTFLAICRAGLVFDGDLVIDPECRTNDPFVFAAGNATKYSRNLYAETLQHKYFNSMEVGERLGKTLRGAVEAYQMCKRHEEAQDGELKSSAIPFFRAPKIISCILPGGYHYLHVGKPGKKMPRQMAIRRRVYGEVMVTGSCTSEIGYFRLRMNDYDTIESVTCCSKKNFEVHRMAALYGKHNSMLNEVKYHFRKSLISDFYSYFNEPWAAAIFYDRFECLRVENRATLLSKTTTVGDSLIDDCIRALTKSDWKEISAKDRETIEKKYAGSVYQEELEDNLLDFLQFSEQDLPMYCTPRFVRWLYADLENSPLFNEDR